MFTEPRSLIITDSLRKLGSSESYVCNVEDTVYEEIGGANDACEPCEDGE